MAKHIRLLICGDRKWSDVVPIMRELKAIADDIELVINGGAPGADAIGDRLARGLGMDVEKEMAQWHRFHGAAGPIRNQKMIAKYRPNLVYAFHKRIEDSKGTKDMIYRANKEGIEVRLFAR